MLATGLLSCVYAIKFAAAWVYLEEQSKREAGAEARRAEARRQGVEAAQLRGFLVELDADIEASRKRAVAFDRWYEATKQRRAEQARWLRAPVAMFVTGDPRYAVGLLGLAAAQSDGLKQAIVARFGPTAADRQRAGRLAEHDRLLEAKMRNAAGK